MMARSSIDAEENHDPLSTPPTVTKNLTQQPHVENQIPLMLTHGTDFQAANFLIHHGKLVEVCDVGSDQASG